jgi:D-alanine-D-alanine ligase-like ATP-grasp enzyme
MASPLLHRLLRKRAAAVPQSRDYYPFVTRTVLRLMAEGRLPNITSIDVEPDYGHMTRIGYRNGSYRVTFGYNFGINLASSTELAKDKGYTKLVLGRMGIRCPKGEEFLLPWWYEQIGRPQQERGNTNVRTTASAASYIAEHLHYPVYIKPVDGSRGENIFLARSDAELAGVVERYNTERIRLAVIEEPISLPDYRVVCLDGKLICAYRRDPLHIIGDGAHTVAELLHQVQRTLKAAGREAHIGIEDERLRHNLAQRGVGLGDVPAAGEYIVLAAISNLSAGGSSEDVTGAIHQHWVDLAATIAKGFGLRLIGLDLACADITSPSADYCVFEVNSSPGFDHYAASGHAQMKRVEDLYVSVLNALPSNRA